MVFVDKGVRVQGGEISGVGSKVTRDTYFFCAAGCRMGNRSYLQHMEMVCGDKVALRGSGVYALV